MLISSSMGASAAPLSMAPSLFPWDDPPPGIITRVEPPPGLLLRATTGPMKRPGTVPARRRLPVAPRPTPLLSLSPWDEPPAFMSMAGLGDGWDSYYTEPPDPLPLPSVRRVVPPTTVLTAWDEPLITVSSALLQPHTATGPEGPRLTPAQWQAWLDNPAVETGGVMTTPNYAASDPRPAPPQTTPVFEGPPPVEEPASSGDEPSAAPPEDGGFLSGSLSLGGVEVPKLAALAAVAVGLYFMTKKK